MTAPGLVCCGLATLDVVQRVDRVPGPDEKLVARGLDMSFGGPAASAAATAAALGVPVVLVTALGAGPIARLVRNGLVAAGVRVVDLAADAPGDPPVSTVLVTASTGQRAVVSTNATLRPDDLGPAAARVVEEVLAGAGAVLVDGHHLAAGIAVARTARRRGIPVLADGGSWKPGLEQLLAHVDVAILSADFVVPAMDPTRVPDVVGRRAGEPTARVVGDPGPGAGLSVGGAGGSGCVGADDDLAAVAAGPGPVRVRLPSGAHDDLAAVAALGPSFVARSAGPGPVRVRLPSGAHDEVTPPPLRPGDVVDTLGAGDVLHGAAGAALARGMDPLTALREGIAVATESVRHAGALGWVAARR